MPATNEELIAALALPGLPAAWRDGSPVTDEDRGNIIALRRYVDRLRADREAGRSEPQQRALTLLRSLLTPGQRRQLGREKCFTVVAPSGNRYRLYPATGHAESITRHGKRWFRKTAYCVHDERDDADAMPAADLTVAHLLMILADESGFLATANARDMRDQLWNGEYLRRMRRRHRPAEAG